MKNAWTCETRTADERVGNAHINQSLHKVMYPPAPRVETIVYIKKENGSIVYNSPHNSVSQKRLEKYLRDEREQSSHSDSKRRECGKESVSCADFALINDSKVS
jgi:hypothetical protein